MADDASEAAGLLWEQALRQLLQQSADLDTLRTRAVAMLSVAALYLAGDFWLLDGLGAGGFDLQLDADVLDFLQ